MTDYKLVPIGPTPEMVEAAEDAYMPFGDMELAVRMALLAAPAVQGEPVSHDWDDQDKCRRCGDRDWYASATCTPKQQQPSLQSPPDDPLGGLEHRADGESNFYTLSRPTGNWVARIQFNGELHTHEQERILNAMLSDRNVRYGDGYHQGYWDARQKSPNVAGLAGKMGRLIAAGNRLNAEAEECTYDDGMAEVAGSEYWCEFRDALEAATEALAAHRKQGGGV